MTNRKPVVTIHQWYKAKITVKSITYNKDGQTTVYDWEGKNITLVIGDRNTDYAPTRTGEIYTSTITPTEWMEAIVFTIPPTITDNMWLWQGIYDYRIEFDDLAPTDLYPIKVTK